MKQPQAYHSG